MLFHSTFSNYNQSMKTLPLLIFLMLPSQLWAQSTPSTTGSETPPASAEKPPQTLSVSSGDASASTKNKNGKVDSDSKTPQNKPKDSEKPTSNVTITTVTVSTPTAVATTSTFDFPDTEMTHVQDKTDRKKFLTDFCNSAELSNCNDQILSGRSILLGKTMSAIAMKEQSDLNVAPLALIVHSTKGFSRKEAIDFLNTYKKNILFLSGKTITPSRTTTAKVKRSSSLSLEYEWLLDLPPKEKGHLFVLKNKKTNHSYLVLVTADTIAAVQKSKIFRHLFVELDSKP